VPLERHAMATRSLLAHLEKLAAEGQATEIDGAWRAVDL
jgi:hypothetical protein